MHRIHTLFIQMLFWRSFQGQKLFRKAHCINIIQKKMWYLHKITLFTAQTSIVVLAHSLIKQWYSNFAPFVLCIPEQFFRIDSAIHTSLVAGQPSTGWIVLTALYILPCMMRYTMLIIHTKDVCSYSFVLVLTFCFF
jgi:hypothetical protein